MGEPIYNVGDVINKTLIARKRVPVYRHPIDNSEPFLYVAAGDPVGVVYSYLDVKPSEGRNKIWWMYWDGANGQYYSPHEQGLYDVDALRQQGVLSTKEQAEAKEKENMPWYERLISKYGIWVVGGIVVAAGVKGYFSRPTKS